MATGCSGPGKRTGKASALAARKIDFEGGTQNLDPYPFKAFASTSKKPCISPSSERSFASAIAHHKGFTITAENSILMVAIFELMTYIHFKALNTIKNLITL
jgi:hypothetical protein